MKEYRAREAVKTKSRAYMRDYAAKNKERLVEKRREYYLANKDRFREYHRKRSLTEEFKAAHNEVTARRRAAGAYRRVDPSVRFLYALCRTISKATGVPHHVDHIFPLSPNGNSFCGLHNAANLRIIPADANHRKHRKILNA